MRSLAVLSEIDLSAWQRGSREEVTPGGRLPYGLGNAELFGWRPTWQDHSGSLVSLEHRAGIERRAPGLRGIARLPGQWPTIRSADAVLSIFEQVGLAYGRARAFSGLRSRLPVHAMLTCWLAESAQRASRRQLRSLRRSIAGIDRLIVFSRNQWEPLSDHLGLNKEQFAVVPFGVDVDAYTPTSEEQAEGGGGGVVAVGHDRARDYETLFRAARGIKVPITVACSSWNLAGLDIPANVQVRPPTGYAEYRRLLLDADVVVTPTEAPAYPSGQSVILEAMAMGKACISTDSPAMRDYVAPDTDGVLVPPRDAEALSEAINALLTDADRRLSLGRSAQLRVRTSFTFEAMWSAVAGVLSDSTGGSVVDAGRGGQT